MSTEDIVMAAGRGGKILAKIKSLLRLFRMELPIAAGVCLVLGEVFALGRFPQ